MPYSEEDYERQMMDFLSKKPSPKEIRIWFSHAAFCDLNRIIRRHKPNSARELEALYARFDSEFREREGFDWDLMDASIVPIPNKPKRNGPN
ncbi:MAG: hypothetical protein AAF741_06145 [Bacteroidota bacterium]